MKNWWTNIISEGDRVGYYVNEKMSWLILKSEALLETTTNFFSNSKANIATEEKRRLGSAVGSKTFKKKK